MANNRLGGVPLRAWVLLSLVIGADGFDIGLLGFLAPSIAADFGLSVVQIGLLLGAQQAGVAISGAFGGAAGDRVGRRLVICISVALFGLFNCLAAAARSAELFLVARMICGLGLGAISPNVASYFTETLPIRWRSRFTAGAFVAIVLGSIGCAIAVKSIEPVLGWRGLFVIGGAVPLLLIPLVFWTLPESPAWLISRKRPSAEIAAALNRLLGTPACSAEMHFVSSAQARHDPASAASDALHFLRALPLQDMAALWSIILMLQFVGIGFSQMGPTVLHANGIALTEAARLMIWYNLAGLGAAIASAWILPLVGSRRLFLALGGVILAALLVLLSLLGRGGVSTQVLIWPFIWAGAAVSALSLLGFPLAAHAYPTAVRSTGVGVAAGLGRVGSVLAPAVIGFWMRLRGPSHAFETLVPSALVLLCAAAMFRRHIPGRRR